MQLYYKCTKFNDIISKKKNDCNEKKCSNCIFKENVVMNWRCNEYGLDIKKKISYCQFRKDYNIRCEGCPKRGKNFEANF